MSGFENVIGVEQKDDEPILVINEDEFKKAVEISNNPKGVKKQTDAIITSINNQADEYLDLSFYDEGKFSAEDVDAINSMQEIATKINDYFNHFNNDENASTDSLIASLSTLKGKEITKILDLYREPSYHEGAQQWLQKTAGVTNSQSKAMYGHIGSKRQG